jgi:hypothetical protein
MQLFRNTVFPIMFNEWMLPIFTYYSIKEYTSQNIA